MKKKIAWTVGFLVIPMLSLPFVVPAIVRWEIHRRYPDVHFASLDVSWGTVRLHDVNADRGWAVVHAEEVVVQRSDNLIILTKGDATIDLDKRPVKADGEVGGRWQIVAHNFLVRVTKGDAHAELRNTEYNSKTASVCTRNAIVTHAKWGTVTVDETCVQKDLSSATIGQLTVPEKPAALEFDGSFHLVLKDIKIQPKEGHASVGQVIVDAIVAGQTVEADGHDLDTTRVGEDRVGVRIGALSVTHPWLATHAVTFHNLSTELGRKLLAPLDLHVNKATVHVDPTALQVDGKESCQTWAAALPEGLQDGPLAEPQFSGDMSFTLKLHPPSVKITASCKSTCSSLAMRTLRKHFTYTAYDQDGRPFPRVIGPDTEGWVKIDDVSPNVPLAVMQMEDPAFRHHHGFIAEALENSLIADVKAGKFARGGSTITMQLAKNVWLRRDKTVGRKVEELLLAPVLESCMSKDEILETYLNAVEFGPNVYGVGAAADHFFQVEPADLSPAQSFYLASVLPHPRTASPPTAKVMARMGALMQMLVKAGRIPEAMLVETQPNDDTEGWVRNP